MGTGADGTGASRIRQQHDVNEELRSVKAAGDARAGHMAKVRAGSYWDFGQNSL